MYVDNPGSTWQTAGGFGVYYPTMMVNKFGLATGEDYRAQGRMFCDANVTSYRSAWTSPIFWTQPGVAPIRLEGGSAINNFDVYPNPSNGIFTISNKNNIHFKLEIFNSIGQKVSSKTSSNSIQMQLEKGIYLVKIITSDGVATKKLIID